MWHWRCVCTVLSHLCIFRGSLFHVNRPHDDVIKRKLFRVTGPFCVPHKGQWRGALMLYFSCVFTNGWVKNRDAGGLRSHHPQYDVTVMNWGFVNIFRIVWTNEKNNKAVSMFHWHTASINPPVSNHRLAVQIWRRLSVISKSRTILSDQCRKLNVMTGKFSMIYQPAVRVNGSPMGPVRRSVNVFFDVVMSKTLIERLSYRCFETPCHVTSSAMYNVCKRIVRNSALSVWELTWWRHQMKKISAILLFVRGIHRSPVDSPHKGQWRRASMFSI